MLVKKFLYALLLAAATIAAADDALPPWTEGTLDIHQISTGHGNAAFVRFPDGTSLLVDAGDAGGSIPFADARPNASQPTAEWLARYITRAMNGKPRLDYALITHYHDDHMGALVELGKRIPITTLIDRGEDYLPPAGIDAYRTFARDVKREKIRVGRADQIVLLHTRAKYPSFEVRNVAANGDVWTGEDDGVVHIFPPLDTLSADDRPSENMCSAALRLRYGRFDFFTGGDMPGIPDAGAPAWQAVEPHVAKAIGATDVHIVNHHGSIDPASPEFLTALRSQVIILPAWSPTHPSQDALKRILSKRLYPGTRDVFATTLREPTKASIGSRVSQLKAQHGHIVVRVAPGGATFTVYVLDDESEEAKVVSVNGPYTSN